MHYASQHRAVTPRGGPRSFGILALALSWAAFSIAGLSGDVSNAGRLSASHSDGGSDLSTVFSARPHISETTASAKPAGSPIQVAIPAINVTADITDLGLNRNGTVEVPQNPDEAGWYRKGPKPGEPGSAVILGHVDSKIGPAVFYRLKSLNPGDQVTVKLDTGMVAHFAVTRVTHYAIEDFPRQKVYAGRPGRPALNLVTCGGRYDEDAGGYQSNVVAYATYLWASNGDKSTG